MGIVFSVVFGLLFGLFFSLVIGLIKPKWVCFPSRMAILKGMGVIFVLMIILGIMIDGAKNEHEGVTLFAFLAGFLVLFVLDIKINISDKKEDDPFLTLNKDKKNSEPKERKKDKHLKIVYYNEKNQQSERTIDVISFGKNKIFAYCNMRNEERNFKISNIIECVDADTGEIVSDVYAYLSGVNEEYEVTPKISVKIDRTADDSYEVDQYLDDVPVYTKKTKSVSGDKFKIPKYSTKKSDFLHIKDVTDYRDLKREVKSLEDYNFLAQNTLEFEINYEDELFEVVDKKFFKKHQEDLMLTDKEINALSKKSEFSKNVFMELYDDYIDDEYPNDSVLEKESFRLTLNLLSTLIIIGIEELIEDWHIIAKYEVFNLLYSDYDGLKEKIDKKVEFYKEQIDLNTL